MEPDNEITGAFILKNRRSKRNFEVPPEVEIASPGAKQIGKAAALRFAKACDAGVWNRIATIILEPANPFDHKAARRLRRETVVLGSIIVMFLVTALYFNVLAR
jgi:hypothetical protein